MVPVGEHLLRFAASKLIHISLLIVDPTGFYNLGLTVLRRVLLQFGNELNQTVRMQ